jgi:hypothetical protein
MLVLVEAACLASLCACAGSRWSRWPRAEAGEYGLILKTRKSGQTHRVTAHGCPNFSRWKVRKSSTCCRSGHNSSSIKGLRNGLREDANFPTFHKHTQVPDHVGCVKSARTHRPMVYRRVRPRGLDAPYSCRTQILPLALSSAACAAVSARVSIFTAPIFRNSAFSISSSGANCLILTPDS